MHLRSLVPAALAVLGSLAFVAPALARAAQDEAAPAPALGIDGEAVPWRTFAAWLVQIQGESQVDAFVNLQLLERAAREAGLTVTDEDVLQRVREQVAVRVERAFHGDRSRWLAELASLGSDERTYEVQQSAEARPGVLADRILAAERVVTEDEVRALFERRYGRDGRRLVLRAIRLRLVVETPEGDVSLERRQRETRAAQERLEARLQVLRDRAVAGESFTDLALEYSEDEASRARDGVLADPIDRGGWPANVIDAVYALAPGEISAPLYGRGFYNLFQLVREERVTLDDVREELFAELQARPASAGEMAELETRLHEGCVALVQPAMFSGGDDPEDVVLTIDGEEITRGTYAAWLGVRRGPTLARSFVEGWLIEREARAAGIDPTAKEVEERVDAELVGIVGQAFGGDKAKWLADLARRGTSEEQVRRERMPRTRVDLCVEQLMVRAREIGPEAVRRRWEETYGPGGRLLDVRLIEKAIELPGNIASVPREQQKAIAAAAVEKAMGELSELRSRALAGEDFGALAAKHSDDATRASGGRPAGRFPFTKFPDTVRIALYALKPGGLTEPMQIGPGCWLFEQAGETIVPLDKVADEMRAELEAQLPGAAERAGYMNAALQRCEWQVLPENFR